MKKLLAIDGNAIGFAAHAMPRLKTGDLETQAIYGFLRSLRVLMQTYKDFDVFVAWDGASWRKTVCEEYKATRDDNPKKLAMRDAYKAQRPYIARALRLLGVRQMFAINMEADDLIAMTVARMKGKGRMGVITGDRDLLQLVNANTFWLDPIREHRVTANEFTDYTGYADPIAFLQGKALKGDVSDNISGVGGLGEKAAALILRDFGSVGRMLALYEVEGEAIVEGELARFRKKIVDFCNNTNGGRDIFKRNMRLMQLVDPRGFPQPENLKVQHQAIDADGFASLCEELAFISILKDFDLWLEPFHDRALA